MARRDPERLPRSAWALLPFPCGLLPVVGLLARPYSLPLVLAPFAVFGLVWAVLTLAATWRQRPEDIWISMASIALNAGALASLGWRWHALGMS